MSQIKLFTEFTIKKVTFNNRIAVSPMCQYSSENGFANDWHLVHLGSRALGGAGLVMTEATSVTPEGRISPQDLGIWSDDHIDFLQRITRFISLHHAVPGMQIAHAGRKASTYSPWQGRGSVLPAEGGWQPIAPSAVPFSEQSVVPHALSLAELNNVIVAFAKAARRAYQAGFKVLEIHAAHGYFLHEFLSPLSNQRQDQYGGDFDNRIRLLLEVVTAVKQEWPSDLPLFVRLSATDWVDGGWNIDETVKLSQRLKALDVDLIDTSSGALVPYAKITPSPGFQAAFAERIRREAKIATGAVGLIIAPAQAEHILQTEQADLILLGREMLRHPYWPLHAATALNVDVVWPNQYQRAKS